MRLPLFPFRPSNLQLFYKQPQLDTNVTELHDNFNHFLPGLEKNWALLSPRLTSHGRRSPALYSGFYLLPTPHSPGVSNAGSHGLSERFSSRPPLQGMRNSRSEFKEKRSIPGIKRTWDLQPLGVAPKKKKKNQA